MNTSLKVDTVAKKSAKYDHILKMSNSSVDPMWILLDNQYTVNVFYNSKLLLNIREVSHYLRIYSTGEMTWTNMIGDLPGYGTVWFHPDGIANILSLAKVKKHFV
mgnify:CR=1 FL=1